MGCEAGKGEALRESKMDMGKRIGYQRTSGEGTETG